MESASYIHASYVEDVLPLQFLHRKCSETWRWCERSPDSISSPIFSQKLHAVLPLSFWLLRWAFSPLPTTDPCGNRLWLSSEAVCCHLLVVVFPTDWNICHFLFHLLQSCLAHVSSSFLQSLPWKLLPVETSTHIKCSLSFP